MRQVRDRMGMAVTLDVRDGDAEAALEAAFADVELIDTVFSPFRAESAVSLLNAGRPLPDAWRSLVEEVDALCAHYRRATAGCFSAWRGGCFDPSGLVKGWAIDRACSILERHGCRHYLVDAGGDFQVRGGRALGEPWRIGIRHPVQRDQLAEVVELYDGAVATSGTYEKGQHIEDPRHDRPAAHWLSFSVRGPDILNADVWATAGCVMGADGPAAVAALPGYEVFAIDRNLTLTRSAGF